MPATINDIDLYVQTYRSALKSSLEITLHSLTSSHLRFDSILHPYGNNPKVIDFSALIYSLLRIPAKIDRTRLVLIGQNPKVFSEAGFDSINTWDKVTTPARRRTTYFNPHTHILACLISSISDVDDIVNILIAYQSEWNKFHTLLKAHYATRLQFRRALTTQKILTDLNITPIDWQTFTIALGPHWKIRLRRIYSNPQDIRLRLLAGSWIDYTKTIQFWWKKLNNSYKNQFKNHLSSKTIYLVSSNNHSLINLVTGFPLTQKNNLLNRLKTDRPDLYLVWQKILSKEMFLPQTDFINFIYKYYQSLGEYSQTNLDVQTQLNLLSVKDSDYLDVNTQIIPISSLAKSKHLDSRLKISKAPKLQHSDALIINIDYPLGFAAYHVLNEIFENVTRVAGLYVLGKAAVLNSEVGDIEIPKVVFDEHTQNTYLFNNCFNTFFPFPYHQGSILTHQKAVSVLGTFLQNDALLQKYLANNMTVIEMESGPYLSAVTEATYDQQLPRNTIVDLNQAPLDIGIINYTSDTPYSQAKNLGAGSLELQGVEPVYLGSLAILQRIINLEESSK